MPKFSKKGLTFDDVLLIPQESNILPAEINLSTKLTQSIELKSPIMSASMDTVTESAMAIAMASLGGIGIIHKNMTSEEQAEEVLKVKYHVIDSGKYPNAAKDKEGKLLVGAGIGITGDMFERAATLVHSKVDVIVVDTAHGHSENVIYAITKLKDTYEDLQIIAGNVVTAAATLALIEAGVDAIKVGVGPGSICTTRIVAGVGVPQITAISDCYEIAKSHDIPVIADGGIKYSGDLTKAIAAGANVCMLGSLLAGHDESPGEIETHESIKYKVYRGMGSMSSMELGSSDRYLQGNSKKYVPEGIEGRVPYKGSVENTIYQLLGGLRSGMGYCGCSSIEKLKNNSEFIIITPSGLRESHPHTINIAKDAPNYKA